MRDAQLLLKDDEDLVLAVYDYWLAKRLRLVSANSLPVLPEFSEIPVQQAHLVNDHWLFVSLAAIAMQY